MSFFSNIILNLILVIFPFLIYLIMHIYFECNNKKENNYFMVATIISLILILIFSNRNFLELSIIIFVPVLFNYIKGNIKFSLIISFAIIIINNYYFHLNLFILILEYFLYFITYIIHYKKNISISNFINKFIIIKSFFLSFYVFYLYFDYGLNINVIYIIFSIIISYLLSFTYYYLLCNNVNFVELEKEKRKNNSQINAFNYLCAITHELRNSLSVSRGYLDILNNCDKCKESEYLQIVKEEIAKAVSMIDDSLNVSKTNMNYEILDINLLLEDVSSTLKEVLNKNKIKYQINYIDDDIYILGDYDKLKQVFINILKNSIQTQNKNLIIEIDNIIVKDNICVSIKDNCYGIIEQKSENNKLEIENLFSKDIIDRHHGHIVYESNYDKGTTINVFLPLFK